LNSTYLVSPLPDLTVKNSSSYGEGSSKTYDFLYMTNIGVLKGSGADDSGYSPNGSQTWETVTNNNFTRTSIPDTDVVIPPGKMGVFHCRINSYNSQAFWEFKYLVNGVAASGGIINAPWPTT
jgi:hypothetical protein